QAKLFHLMLAALHGSINSTSTPECACCTTPTSLAGANFNLRTPGAVSNAWRDIDPNVAAYLANVYNNGIHTTLYSNPNMYTVDYLAALSGDYRLWDRQNNEYRGNHTACPTSNCGPCNGPGSTTVGANVYALERVDYGCPDVPYLPAAVMKAFIQSVPQVHDLYFRASAS